MNLLVTKNNKSKIAVVNENPTAPAGSNAAFQKLLCIGLGLWFLTQVVLIAIELLSEPRGNWISAVDWAFGYGWIGFLVGLLALVAIGVRHPDGLRRALPAYAVPFGLYAIISAIFFAVYPDRWFLAEILGILPLVWLFGVFGWIWLRLRPEPNRDALSRALLPPLVGGIAILMGLGVPTFRSNNFIYRDAFSIEIKNTAFADGKLAVDAVLEIRKPGDYHYRATKYTHMDMMNADDSAMDNMVGRIDWTSSAPKAAATGTYPLTIRWDKSAAPSTAAEDPMGEDCIVIDVFKKDEPETAIKTITLALRAE